MKKLIIAAAVVMTAVFTVFAYMRPAYSSSTDSDSDGHVLVELWKQYNEAVQKDRPKKQSEIAKEIIAEAEKQHLPWDFYDAWRCYISAESSINWKTRESNWKEFTNKALEFDEPIVVYSLYHSGYAYSGRPELNLDDYVKENASRLKTSRNEAFYTRSLPSEMSGQLTSYISNDYEYILWSNYDYEALIEYLGDSYPNGVYAEYKNIAKGSMKDTLRREATKLFAEKYKGKALGLYAEGDLLNYRMNDLNKKKAGQEEYKALDRDCESFERERKSYVGKEAKLVGNYNYFRSLHETLNEKSVIARVENNKLKIFARNVNRVKISVSESGEKDVILSETIDNTTRSFYVRDTLVWNIPALNDGEYTINVVSTQDKTAQHSVSLTRYSISMASRVDSKGRKVYAADQKTGRPLGKADLVLNKNGAEIARVKNFEFRSGFTAIPDEFARKIKDNNKSWFEIYCSFKATDGLIKKSDPFQISETNNFSRDRFTSSDYCHVYTDRGAYNPGDTLCFKGVLYSGNLVNSVKVASFGLGVTAILRDSEWNEVETLELETNEYGSVAGKFVLPEGLRNGMFHIQLSSGGYEGSTSVRVDEFVLPTFSISFDNVKELYLPGDMVKISGKIDSYSGHSIVGADISYKVTSGVRTIKEDRLEHDSDGHFELEFLSDEQSAFYNVSVKVVDGTGETQEAQKTIFVNKNVSLSANIENTVDASCELISGGNVSVLTENLAKLNLKVLSRGETVPGTVTYELNDEKGKLILSGQAESGEIRELDLSSYASGLYTIVAKTSVKANDGEVISDESKLSFLKISETDKVIDAPVKSYFRAIADEVETGENIKVQFGTADGPVWAVVELFGADKDLLERRMVNIGGERGKNSSFTTIEYEYKESYPDAVFFQIFYFKNSSSERFNREFRRHKHTLDLPLEWTSFEDKTLPGREYTFTLKTSPSVEILAAIYDKSIDRISSNYWATVSMRQMSAARVGIVLRAGRNSDELETADILYDFYDDEDGMFSENVVVGYGVAPKVRVRGLASANAKMATLNLEVADMAVMAEEAAVESAEEMPEVDIRENFAKTLAFEPFLRSGKDGKAELKFRTSDKLSTFNVRLFAHDRSMRNAYLSREMVVSIPVKVSLAEPKYLYIGDKYKLALNVSSNAEEPVSGTMYLYQYDGRDYQNSEPVRVSSQKVTIPAKASLSHSFDVAVPEKEGEIGLKAAFVADGFSDGVFVSVPVYQTSQVLTEAHSAVILPGMDKESELGKIRKAFVNTSYHGAEYKEISIIDMVKEAIPTMVEPKNDDVLSLSEAYYIRKVAESLGMELESVTSNDKIVERVIACHNADGGFGWFEGMNSSQVITAVLLERFAKLRDAGLGNDTLDKALESAVKYLDDSYFRVDWPYWCGGISMEQYLFVRSLYPGVVFDPKDSGNDFAKRMKEFRKEAKEYLVPKKERGLNGAILSKARRLRTLSELVSSDEGVELAGKWGVTLGARRKMLSSLEDDVVSLLEYASDHKDGGMYYPNAVMPFRGLLESEAYAHSLICDLFTDYAAGFGASVPAAKASETLKVADGIRIWLMLQKETQKWGEEPAFVDAINSVMSGSDEVKATKVILLTKTYEKPFREIKPAGNGFSIERKFFLNGEEIVPGTALKVGDRVRVEYRIHNDENRSFVVLRAPREASLRPVQQLSGMYGWGIRPLRISSWFSFQPHGYRNVKSARTEFYFDSYPEEQTTISEEFYVIQSGSFNAPVVEIESLYAPHYRANGGYVGALEVSER